MLLDDLSFQNLQAKLNMKKSESHDNRAFIKFRAKGAGKRALDAHIANIQ